MDEMIHQILEKVKEYIDRAYNNKAPSNRTFPYAVISYRGYGDDVNRSDFICEIQLIDSGTNSYNIEQIRAKMMKSVGLNGLDHYNYNSTKLNFEMFYDDMDDDEIESDKEYLMVRSIEFIVKTYFYQ